MTVPAKRFWTVTAGSGEPAAAIDDSYSTLWSAAPEPTPWLAIDLGATAVLGGLEIYWGELFAEVYTVERSLDGVSWLPLCATRYGEGGQNVFAFDPTEVRHLRWSGANAAAGKGVEIVQINLYAPEQAARVLEPGRAAALCGVPVSVPVGESITVDLGYVRSPLGVLVKWGETYGTRFSVHLSDDGEIYREVGRIETGNGDYDNFYWRITTARCLRFTVHEASDPAGAVIEELKLRILNKDRMPIGRLERAAAAGRAELFPQSLLNRQVYWTVLGEWDHPEEALFDEFGNLEPGHRQPQIMPLIRSGARLHGAAGAAAIDHTLAEGSLPVPSLRWSPCAGLEVASTAFAHAGAAIVEHRVTNTGTNSQQGTLVLTVRPVQINPYWQHGGHAVVGSIALDGRELQVNGRPFLAVSREPDAATVADFTETDVVGLIESGPQAGETRVQSASGLLSAALEFDFVLAPGESAAVVLAAPLRAGVVPVVPADFGAARDEAIARWRQKLGPRRISVGDATVSDTVEAQIGLILVNATRHAFKPGPRHYDRVWIRDGSSQALALAYAGLIDEAKTYVRWYAQRIYPNGMVPPILNPDGSINRGYGSDIEYDAQGQFITIAADLYRLAPDRDFLEAIYEPVVRAARCIDELCAKTRAQFAPDSRFYGLVAPSISHEGYNKPTYSYWDDFFALSGWRRCAELAAAIGDRDTAAWAETEGLAFAQTLARSLRLTSDARGLGLVPASADREDVDPTSTSIAFDPCRVDDVLPADCVMPTYDLYAKHLTDIRAPDFKGGFTPYEIRNLNALVALDRKTDAFGLLDDSLRWHRPAGWRYWAEVVWGEPRVAEYIGDMPHTWIGAEFTTAIRRMLVRENGDTLELFRAVPDAWWAGDGIRLQNLPTEFGPLSLHAQRTESTLSIQLTLPSPNPPRLRIRCPGTPHSLTVDGDHSAYRIEGQWVCGPAFEGRIDIEFVADI